MTKHQAHLWARLKRLGFTTGTEKKLYGEVFDFLGEPIVLTDDVVLVDAKEKKSGLTRRVRIPLPIIQVAKGSSTVASANGSIAPFGKRTVASTTRLS